MWIKEWAALGALDYAIDHDVPQIIDLYLGHMAVAPRPYLVFELRGHGFTESGEPRTSAKTIAETLEAFFADQFAAKRVLLYASKGAYTGELKRLAKEHRVPLYVRESEKELRARLAAIDAEFSS